MNPVAIPLQIDLKHKDQKKGKDNKVEIGIELREYYPSVEWDILDVPAERHEEFYPCCSEPYPGMLQPPCLRFPVAASIDQG